MGDFSVYFFLFYIVGTLILLFASLEREVKLWQVILVSIIGSPIIGFLFVLCFPTTTEVDIKNLLRKMVDKEKLSEEK